MKKFSSTNRILGFLIAGLMLVGHSSCRIGNRVENPPAAPTSASGFYETAPTALRFCVQLTSESTERCHDASTNQVPSLISSIMSNPVIFYIVDSASGQAVFSDYTATSAQIPIYFDKSSRQLSYLGRSSPTPLPWDSECTRQLYLEESGEVQEGPSKKINERETRGHLSVDIEVSYGFAGNCTSALSSLSACYQDQAKCGGESALDNEDLHFYAQEIIGDYITQGILAPTEIPLVSGTGYRVSYR